MVLLAFYPMNIKQLSFLCCGEVEGGEGRGGGAGGGITTYSVVSQALPGAQRLTDWTDRTGQNYYQPTLCPGPTLAITAMSQVWRRNRNDLLWQSVWNIFIMQFRQNIYKVFTEYLHSIYRVFTARTFFIPS